MITLLAALSLLLSAIPCGVFLRNLRLYRSPGVPAPGNSLPAVSVLIPARNEERTIAASVNAALASRGVVVEVIVLDDHSEDGTAACVNRITQQDARVRLLDGPDLPEGWCGKQFACATLAEAARNPVLVFIDADVRITPDGLARLLLFLEESQADLVSGIPRQETGTFLERLLIPLIHFVLLGFLPLRRMRRSSHPSYGAGCGQLFMARRDAYFASGGHAAIRDSLHDGVRLPRAFRNADFRTDLCDATDLASCRMYRNATEVWNGLAKNATEGLGSPGLIVPSTLLLFGGQVLPFVLLGVACLTPAGGLATALSAVAVVGAGLPRILAAFRYRQSWLGACLHPLGILLLLTVQWHAFFRQRVGRPAAWKGRRYVPASIAAASCIEATRPNRRPRPLARLDTRESSSASVSSRNPT
ncbi:MAG TPA: glycosyltransferase family 2 protein [Planctomycetaceae bacterium]|nr:glycosyltransferase family 2 protein [Planctomycetaceae bacterium]